MHRIILGLSFALCVAACGGKSNPDPAGPPMSPPAQGACITTGCSGIVCAEPGKEVMTTCEYKAEYGCYKTAKCERQANGSCGWTESPELTACLANPPPM
jgi:eight-cysteine-cluster-containing protein